MPDPRTRDVAANLAAVRERVAAACSTAGRDPGGVHLIVITKTYPAADVLRLAALGMIDIGENRDQEAAPKAAEVDAAGARVRWHFVGRLQRNKCRSVARYATMVHSVDSVRLVEALNQAVDHESWRPGAPAGATDLHDRRSGWPSLDVPVPLDVLVQVSLDGDAARGGAVEGGADPDVDLDGVLAAASTARKLRLRGLMAVAPLGWEPGRAFARLAEIRTRILKDYPDATILSAGMSGDLEEAIQHGATHVRVGSAVLGPRPPGP